MRFTDLYVDGFGALAGLSIQDLSPGLNIFHGPNEAGKSTLTAFLRFVLFGRNRGESLAALAGGRLGGRIGVDLGDVRGLAERSNAGELRLSLSDRRQLSGSLASGMLTREVDRALFEAVWMVSLDSLRAFDAIGDASLRDQLFSGALAGAGASVRGAREVLDREATRLWRPRAASPLKALLDRRTELDAALADARRHAAAFAQRQARRDRLGVEAAGAEAEHARALTEQRRLEAWLAASKHAERAASLRATLPEVPRVVDAVWVDRAERLHVDVTLARQGVAHLEAQLADRLEALDRLSSRARALRLAPRLRDLKRDAEDLAPSRVAEADAAVELAERALAARVAQVGDGAELALQRCTPEEEQRLAALASGVAQWVRLDAARTTAEVACARQAAERDQRAAARDEVVVDEVALGLDAEVERLIGLQALVERRRREVQESNRRLAEVARVRQALRERFGAIPVPKSGRKDAVFALSDEVDGWLRARDAAIAKVEALLAASQAVPADPPLPAAPDLGELARQLGPGWRDIDLDRVLESGPEDIEEHARRLRDTTTTATADFAGDVETLRGELEALRDAESLLRSAPAAPATPGWWSWLAVVCLVLVAILALAFAALGVSPVFLGIVALLFAVLSAAIMLRGAAVVPDASNRRAAMERAGLPANATLAECLDRTATVGAALRERQEALTRRAEETRALEAAHLSFESGLRRAGWPALSADAVIAASAQLRAWRRRVDGWRAERASAERDVARFGEQRDRLRGELLRAQAEVGRLDAEGEKHRAAARRLDIPDATPWRQLPAWADAVDELARQNATAEALETERRSAQTELDTIAAAESALLGAFDGKIRSLAAVRDLVVQAKGARREREACVDALRRAEDELERLRAALRATEEAMVGITDPRPELARSLAQVGLPSDLSDARIPGVLSALAQARQAAVALQEARQRREALMVRVERFVEECVGVAADMAAAPAATLPSVRSWLESALTELAQAEDRERRRAEGALAVEQARQQTEVARSTLTSLEVQLCALLSECGASDLPSLRSAVDARKVYDESVRVLEAAEALRDQALGEHRDAFLALPALDVAAWEQELARWRLVALEADRNRQSASEERAVLDDEFSRLASDDAIADLEAERANVESELARQRRAYARVVLARHLLDTSIERFKVAHQPAILRLAADYFRDATQGVYVGLESDGEDLVVIDEHRASRWSNQLSRGTAELLYLVLRIGLAEDLGRQNPLPLILDDVLVNLDPTRAAQTARLLVAASRRHQILLMTCRPETRDLLVQVEPTARVVEMARFQGREAPVPGDVTAVPSAPTSRGPVARAPRGVGLSDASRAVLQVVQTRPGLGRAEIVEASGIDLAQWTPAVGSLLELGVVRSEGERRGTRYFPAEGGTA